MPKGCEECRFFAWKRGVGQHCAVDDRITFHATLDGFDVGYERNGDCPLVHVPPHGRLIDADALDKQIYNDIPLKVFGNIARMAEMRNIVFNAPTVIEGEE